MLQNLPTAAVVMGAYGLSPLWFKQDGASVDPLFILWSLQFGHCFAVQSLIPARFNNFVETDHEIISTVILLRSAEAFKKGCHQLQAHARVRSSG